MFKRAVHPGEVPKGELKELGNTPTEFARQIDVPPNRVSQIIASKRSVTGDTALRFGHWFGNDPQFCSTFRPSTTWFRPTGRPAPRSVISRREPAFRERESLRGSHDQRGSRDAAWRTRSP